MLDSSMSRKEREEFERRRHILDVAERLFALNGFHETSVSDIAREAEFGVGTLYKYFRDKETLFQSLLAERLEQHRHAFVQMVNRPGSVVTILEQMVENWVSTLQSNLPFYQLYFTYVHPRLARDEDVGGLDLTEAKQVQCDNIERLTALFQRGIDSGELKPISADFMASFFNGMMISSFFNIFYGRGGQVDEVELKEAIKEVLFGGVKIK